MYYEVYRVWTYKMLTLLLTLPSITLIRMKKRFMGKPPPIPCCVLYQRCGTLNDDESILRTGEKSLDVTEYTEEPLHRYT